MKGFTNAINNSKDSIETLNVALKTNQQEHTDLVGVVFTLSYGNYTKSFTWEGRTMTIEVPAYVTYTITYEGVEDYKKPEDVTFTAHGGNSRSVTALYQTELVDIALNSSDGSSVNGAVVLINGKSRTWDGTNIKQKVAFGTEYSVEPQSLDGFTTPSSRSFVAEQAVRELSFTYTASALKVNILSNQSTESSWDPTITNIKATVSYGSTTLQVSNGQQINLPSGVNVTISFPEVEGYKKPEDITFTHNGGLVEKSGTYKCELLTVNVSADQGSVSGFEVTISKQEVVGITTKYTRLEYIESNGTQWIDTGVKGIQGFRMECAIKPTQLLSSAMCLLGSAQGSLRTYAFTILTDGTIRYTCNGNHYAGSMKASANILYEVNCDMSASSQSLVVNGTTVSSSTESSFGSNVNMYLFGVNNGGSLSYPISTKMYYCKLYEGSVLVHDYIPALRADGIAGLYDAVNDSFVASSGTGNFIAGAFEPTIIAKQTTVTGSYKIPFDDSYTVSASKVNGYTTPRPVTRIASSPSYVVEQKYEVVKVIDLSLQDIYGNPINRSTANCYVVREVGQYKFPLVFGNAIKNGKVNTAAFTNNGGANSHDFIMSGGDVINSPYIEEFETMGLSARMVTEDYGTITNIEIIDDDICGFVQFDVTSVPSTGANVIIEVSGMDVEWSWHIWIWPHDLSPVEITNSTGVKYNIMPVNLASKYDSDGVHIKNWFYQWGRPMPLLCPSAWNSTTDHTPGNITKASKASNLWTGLDNPTTFYYNSDIPHNWFGDKIFYNLWDAACTRTGASDNDTVKTVYDPCPVGWKVPNGNTFTGLSVLSSANGIVKMSRYSGDTVGVGFAMSGQRNSTDGLLRDVGTLGYSWTSASTPTESFAYGLFYGSNSVTPQQDFGAVRRTYGKSIRPVQDDNIQLDVIMISFKIGTTTYQAESGMTWFEWVNSEYNTGGFVLYASSIGPGDSPKVMYLTSTNKMVYYTEQIIGGASYYNGGLV